MAALKRKCMYRESTLFDFAKVYYKEKYRGHCNIKHGSVRTDNHADCSICFFKISEIYKSNSFLEPGSAIQRLIKGNVGKQIYKLPPTQEREHRMKRLLDVAQMNKQEQSKSSTTACRSVT